MSKESAGKGPFRAAWEDWSNVKGTLHMERTIAASMAIPAHREDPDLALVERYFDGDTAAFDEIMIRYERQIYRVCYRFVENRDDALDLAQDVFVKAFEHLPTFRRESTLKTWLYRIA